MSGLPRLLCGHTAIALHLGTTKAAVQHGIRQQTLPIFRVAGTPCATAGGLDEWRALSDAGKLTND